MAIKPRSLVQFFDAHRFAFTVSSFALAACTAHKVPPAEAPVSAQRGPQSTLAEAEANEPARELEQAQAAEPAPVQAEALQPWHVAMRPDPAFLAQQHPANPKRYSNWRERARVRVGQSHLSSAWISADERHWLAMSEAEGTLRVYDAKTHKLLANHPLPGFTAGAWARGDVIEWPDPQVSAFLVGSQEGLRLLDTMTGSELARFTDEAVWSMRWSPDRRYLIANAVDLSRQVSLLRFYERKGASLEIITQFETQQRVDGIALSHDNLFAAVSTYPGNTLEWIDLQSGKRLWSISAPQYAGAVDVSPNGTQVAVGGDEVWIVGVQDPLAPNTRAIYTKLGNNIHRVKFSPSADALVATAYDGHVRVLSTDASGTTLRLLKDLRHSGSANVYAADFAKDGSSLLTSSGDRTLRWWTK